MPSRRGQGEGAIFYAADRGLWVGRIELPPVDGKRRRKEFTSTDKRIVAHKLSELRRQLDQHGNLPSASQTVEQWMTYWLDNVAVTRVRPNTIKGYRSVVKQITGAIGKVRLDKLQPAHVRRMQDTMIKAGQSSTYALNAHRVLAKALQDAQAEGLIHRNVARLTDAPRKARTDLDALTVDEAIKIIGWAIPELDGQTSDYDERPIRWATYLLTGARRGEVIGLEWDRVTDVIDLSWQLQRVTDITRAPADYEYRLIKGTMYWTRPKSNAGWRIIPLVEPLGSILRAHHERAGDNPYGLVFSKVGEPLDPDTETELAEAAALRVAPDKHVRLHDFRHTTVDLLLDAGVPEDVVMEIVGHSTRAVTRGYKSRGNLTRRTDAMRQLSASLGYSSGV